MLSLEISDFAALFGADVASLPDDSVAKIKSSNWNYTVMEGQERDALILQLLRKIDAHDFSVVANKDNSRWIKGWSENLDAFIASKGDLEALIPKYYKEGIPLRLNQEFIRTEDPRFEVNFFYVYRKWIFENYLKNYPTIFELGSGSGFNIAELGQKYPHSTLHGLDWAAPAVAIIEALRTTKGLNAHGHLFDFFHPDPNLVVPEGSAFYSLGAFEQIGTSWQPMLDFITKKKPAVVLHIEPILEWYEPESSLIDYTAARANVARNYLKGYAPAIVELEKQGRARILKSKRLYFGSTWHDGWSQLFWQPL